MAKHTRAGGGNRGFLVGTAGFMATSMPLQPWDTPKVLSRQPPKSVLPLTRAVLWFGAK